MAKMRATLRKATQVTPPPSPGDDGPKGHWLRNHSTPKCPAVVVPATRNGRRAAAGKTIRIKKEPADDSSPTTQLNGRCSRSSTCSPVCNGRIRTRSASEAAAASSAVQQSTTTTGNSFWGPRRSARLIGIPAELDMTEEEEDDSGEEEEEAVADETQPSGQGRTTRRTRTAMTNGRRISECSAASRATSRTPSPSAAAAAAVVPLEVVETNGGGIFPDDPDLSAISLGSTTTSPEAVQTAPTTSPCKECKQRKKGRSIDALLIESERYLQYPSGSRTSPGCRMRSTYNSSLLRSPSPPTAIRSDGEETSKENDDTSLPLPESVDQVKFSFELVPSGTCWYQTFLRDEAQAGQPLPDVPEGVSSGPAPFLLPYEMSLEAILKSGRPERKKKKTTKSDSSPEAGRKGAGRRKKPAVPQDFRPIISTRLQMQSAARLAAAEAAASSRSSSQPGPSGGKKKTAGPGGRMGPKPLWHLPRKSPRCHASTLAILSSARTSEDEGSTHPEEADPSGKEGEVEEEEKEQPEEDPEWARTLQEMLTHDLTHQKRKAGQVRPGQVKKKKRGRPRKYPRPEEEEETEEAPADGPLTELLATPLNRIGDIVDERVRPEASGDQDLIAFDEEDLTDCWAELRGVQPTDSSSRPSAGEVEVVRNGNGTGGDPFMEDVFHDLDSQSTGGSGGGGLSGSSSVYETASEVGSQEGSTGTCDSRSGRSGKWRRRKRPNMTGWPRSTKKRRPLAHLSIDPEEDDGIPPILSPIHEESIHSASNNSANADSPSRVNYVSKPFQFQRKTLRFVGKRILRPAAQRHAPQRLEYWPCFQSASGRAGGSGSSSSSSRLRQQQQQRGASTASNKTKSIRRKAS